ncbi:Slc35a3, partial [Symbiodinium pilosum]
VHEKGILFPATAAALIPMALPARHAPIAVLAARHFQLVALFSMYPLMVKDSLVIPYALACLFLVALCEAAPTSSARPFLRLTEWGLRAVQTGLHDLMPCLRCQEIFHTSCCKGIPTSWALFSMLSMPSFLPLHGIRIYGRC